MSFWEHISSLCIETYQKFHSKELKPTMWFSAFRHSRNEERLTGILDGMEQILNEVGSKVGEYIQKRDLDKARLTAIQTAVEDQIRYMFNGKCNFDVLPASSFSAGIYLLGESDLT
jgi:hypothetical protein